MNSFVDASSRKNSMACCASCSTQIADLKLNFIQRSTETNKFAEWQIKKDINAVGIMENVSIARKLCVFTRSGSISIASAGKALIDRQSFVTLLWRFNLRSQSCPSRGNGRSLRRLQRDSRRPINLRFPPLPRRKTNLYDNFVLI